MSSHRRGILFFLLVFVSGCTALQSIPSNDSSSSNSARFCASSLLQVDAAFAGGNFHRCNFSTPTQLLLEIHPEDSPPINPSAWYAFRLNPVQATDVSIRLQVQGGPVRYWPKFSRDGQSWSRIAQEQVQRIDDNEMQILLSLGEEPVWIAAQELIQAEDYQTWMAALAVRPDLDFALIGQSVEGREIGVLRTEERPEVVLLLGRQHPPEVTGALAMEGFVSTVLADTPLARRFRERFAVIVIPLLNPDGVLAGHWRHNMNGVDLNRDWGPFTQPETQSVLGLLQDLERRSMAPRLMLDFHSTQESRFYTQVSGEIPGDWDFASRWLARAEARLPDFEFRHDPLVPSSQQNTKNYFFRRYQIPAITYEIGDEVDRDAIRTSSPVFAEEMMRTLLELPPPK